MNKIIQGDTFAPLCIIKNRQGVPVDLTGVTISGEYYKLANFYMPSNC